MRMKDVLLLCAMLSATGCLAQEPESYTKDYKHALRYGAKAKMTLRIVDEAGMPVSNAVPSVVFLLPKAVSNTVVRGLSNEEGLFVAEGVSTKSIGGYVSKDGYYSTNFKCPRGNPADPYDNASKVKDGRWLPWNPTIPVVLREIRNPIPMYATGVDFAKAFPCDKDIGFDCEKRDWVDPHGTGEVADFIVRMVAMELPEQVIKEVADITAAQEAAKDRNAAARFGMDLRRIDRAYYKLVISSVDNDGGFIRKQKVKDSEFVSVYEAPEYGYTPSFETSMEKPPYYEPPNPNDLTGGEYLIFKSRIQRDSKGKIVSANYGKIYGPLEHLFSRKDNLGALKFHYYFNPTPNDRNLEFDTSKNLYKKAKGEHVTLNDKP